MEKHLGKITKVSFGIGGYNDAELGIFFTFEFDNSGIGAVNACWCPGIVEPSSSSKWTESDREKSMINIMNYVAKILIEAKVHKVEELKGKPVEVTIEKMSLVDWRILTEVL